MPPRRMNRGVRSEALVKDIVQVLQVRSDDPRSIGGVSGDLELCKRKSTTAVAFRLDIAAWECDRRSV